MSLAPFSPTPTFTSSQSSQRVCPMLQNVPRYHSPFCVYYLSILTFSLLYLPMSHRSLIISVLMYQPLKPQAGYTIPPQSNNMLLTAGTAYHSKPRSSNLGYLYATKMHCQHAPLIGVQEFTIHGPFIPFHNRVYLDEKEWITLNSKQQNFIYP